MPPVWGNFSISFCSLSPNNLWYSARALRGVSFGSREFFPKQLTVGVLNATFDLAALVLVGVVGFLGSDFCLVSRCLPLSPVVSLHVRGGCWLVWSASWALKWSCLPLSPVVSFLWGVGVGWCGRLLGL